MLSLKIFALLVLTSIVFLQSCNPSATEQTDSHASSPARQALVTAADLFSSSPAYSAKVSSSGTTQGTWLVQFEAPDRYSVVSTSASIVDCPTSVAEVCVTPNAEPPAYHHVVLDGDQAWTRWCVSRDAGCSGWSEETPNSPHFVLTGPYLAHLPKWIPEALRNTHAPTESAASATEGRRLTGDLDISSALANAEQATYGLADSSGGECEVFGSIGIEGASTPRHTCTEYTPAAFPESSIDIWLDSSDRVTRIETTLPGLTGGDTNLTVELSYPTTVNIPEVQ